MNCFPGVRGFPLIRLPLFLWGVLLGIYLEQFSTTLENIQTTSNRIRAVVVDMLFIMMGIGFCYHALGSTNDAWLKTRVWRYFRNVRDFIWAIVLIGVCSDGGTSVSSKFLRTSISQFIGSNSFHLYLMQFVTLRVMTYFYKAIFKNDVLNYKYLYLMYTMVPVLVAHIVRKVVDEPLQKYLHKNCSRKNNII